MDGRRKGENLIKEVENFLLYYQPKIDTKTNTVKSCEALIRLKVDGKIIPPNFFIPQAERDGSIEDIDRWVFERVAQDSRYISMKSQENIAISFNVSGRHLSNGHLISDLEKTFVFEKLFNSSFTVELTETALIKHKETALKTLEQIKEMGFKLAIDDFGTAYASLSYLKDFPIDTLKIDKIFIDEIHENNKVLCIVDSLIYLSEKLNLKTVAEGVEKLEQAEILYKKGCDEIQGYYYSKPLPLNDFITFVNAVNKTKKSAKFILWGDKYSTGSYALDANNMILAGILNNIYEILKDPVQRKKDHILHYTEFVEKYLEASYNSTASYLKRCNYRDQVTHLERFREIKNKLEQFKNNISEVNERNLYNLFNILKEYFEITIEEDREIVSGCFE